MKVFKLANTQFTATLDFNSYHLQKPPKKYKSHVPIEIAKSAKKVDVQMKATVF